LILHISFVESKWKKFAFEKVCILQDDSLLHGIDCFLHGASGEQGEKKKPLREEAAFLKKWRE